MFRNVILTHLFLWDCSCFKRYRGEIIQCHHIQFEVCGKSPREKNVFNICGSERFICILGPLFLLFWFLMWFSMKASLLKAALCELRWGMNLNSSVPAGLPVGADDRLSPVASFEVFFRNWLPPPMLKLSNVVVFTGSWFFTLRWWKDVIQVLELHLLRRWRVFQGFPG